jgi:hypothetical protein
MDANLISRATSYLADFAVFLGKAKAKDNAELLLGKVQLCCLGGDGSGVYSWRRV